MVYCLLFTILYDVLLFTIYHTHLSFFFCTIYCFLFTVHYCPLDFKWNEPTLNIVKDLFFLEPLHPRWMSFQDATDPKLFLVGLKLDF